jgi:mono/diheme cytochrome c family protein
VAKRTTLGRPRRGPLRAILDITLGRLLKWAFVLFLLVAVLGGVAFWAFIGKPANDIPADEPVDRIVYLDQGWGTDAASPLRQTYYYTPQGTSLPQGALTAPLRYDWFLALEMPTDSTRFAAPGHLRRYRFLVDAAATPKNPDHLPVGFTQHYDPAIGERVLDLTCAACHTGELHATKDGSRVAIRIDGGQAMHAFTDLQKGAFGPTLIGAMAATWINPWKFDRFARKVIGARYPAGKDKLRGALWDTIVAFATQGQNDPLRHLYPVREGFGRTDALGRIANTVFGDHLIADNYQEGAAPVSYPYVWNIWKFDWVQYTGSVKQPLARNIGEALGVGAVLRMTDDYGNAIPKEQRFDSSVIVPNLVGIERTLQQLKPPPWPEQLLGAIDRPLAAQGQKLFAEHCVMCHGPHPASRALQVRNAPGKPSPDVEWQIEVIPLAHIGTDPVAATAFVQRKYDLTAAGLTNADLASALKPSLVRDLARDVRYRLDTVVELRRAAGDDVATLEPLLAAYPDPDALPEPSLPADAFAAIAQALDALGVPPANAAPTEPAYRCRLDCQQAWLRWDVAGAAADIDRRLAALDPKQVTEGEGLNILGLMLKARWFAKHQVPYEQQQCVEGFGTLDLPQQVAGYKPRPLQGVWATPPFLHNGSVPNLHEMLLPPEQRSRKFFVGRRDFDPVKVGYVTEPDADGEDDGFWLDTTVDGNRNTGHAFSATPEQWDAYRRDPTKHPLPPGVIGRQWTDDERKALVEYLKVHEDTPATPADFVPPDCGLAGTP